MWGYGLNPTGSVHEQVEGSCECGNVLSGSIKCGEFPDQLRTGQFLKNVSAAWSE
jgi:hypothetical protein